MVGLITIKYSLIDNAPPTPSSIALAHFLLSSLSFLITLYYFFFSWTLMLRCIYCDYILPIYPWLLFMFTYFSPFNF